MAGYHEAASCELDGDIVWSRRRYERVRPSGRLDLSSKALKDVEYDRFLDVRWTAPSAMLLVSGSQEVGASDVDRRFHSHLCTPETEHSTHYWFSVTYERSLGAEFEAAAETEARRLAEVFVDEDLLMLAAQQAVVGGSDFMSHNPILLAGDGAAVRARRILERMIASEQQTAT